MKKISILLLSVLSIISCKNHSVFYDWSYNGEPNYQGCYIVDTIQISDYLIKGIENGEFVFSKSAINQDGTIEKNFTNRPDVFILVDGWNLLRLLSPKDAASFGLNFEKKYNILDHPLKPSIRDTIIINGVQYEKYKASNVKFILCLVNANHFNKMMTCIDCAGFYSIENDDYKNSYYKVVSAVSTK